MCEYNHAFQFKLYFLDDHESHHNSPTEEKHAVKAAESPQVHTMSQSRSLEFMERVFAWIAIFWPY